MVENKQIKQGRCLSESMKIPTSPTQKTTHHIPDEGLNFRQQPTLPLVSEFSNAL